MRMEQAKRGDGVAVVESDRPWSVERHAIEPIPDSDRHGKPVELFRMWIGANINYVVLVTGSLAFLQVPSFGQATSAILVGNLFGCIVVGLCSIMGPRTGTAGILGSGACFGLLGAFLPMAISLVSALSWFSIQSVVATQSLQELFKLAGVDGMPVAWLCVILVLAAEIALAVFGHATIIAAERWIGWVLAVLFAGLAWFILPLLPDAAAAVVPAPPAGSATARWWIAVGIIAAYPVSWANFASDYSRYFPARTSWRRITLAVAGGQFVSVAFCELIGVLLGMALHGALGNDPVGALDKVLPHWYLVPFLFAVILGGIAANVPNGYTAALGMLSLRIPITRTTSLAIIAVFTLVVRGITMVYGQFFDVYQQFLDYIVYWTAPWAAILIADYFMRSGSYRSGELLSWGRGAYWYRNGIFAPGLLAFVAGVVASVMCSNTETYASPFAVRFLGGIDLSLEAGLLVSPLVYFLLARQRLGGSARAAGTPATAVPARAES
jgi:NCS1 family nucleobase:cation symporter-1